MSKESLWLKKLWHQSSLRSWIGHFFWWFATSRRRNCFFSSSFVTVLLYFLIRLMPRSATSFTTTNLNDPSRSSLNAGSSFHCTEGLLQQWMKHWNSTFNQDAKEKVRFFSWQSFLIWGYQLHQWLKNVSQNWETQSVLGSESFLLLFPQSLDHRRKPTKQDALTKTKDVCENL